MRYGCRRFDDVARHPMPLPFSFRIEVLYPAAVCTHYDIAVAIDISRIESAVAFATVRAFNRQGVFNKQMRAAERKNAHMEDSILRGRRTLVIMFPGCSGAKNSVVNALIQIAQKLGNTV